MFAWHLSQQPAAPVIDFSLQTQLDDLKNKLKLRDAELASLRAELARLSADGDSFRKQVEELGISLDPAQEGKLDIQRLLNDARPLLKSMAAMFGDQRKKMVERWIRGMADKLAEDLGLTPEQKEAMIAHFLAEDEANFQKIRSMLDRPIGLLDVFTLAKDLDPRKKADEYLSTALTGEQLEKWKTKQLTDKAQQLERGANWQLDRLTKDLNLNESQKDQVFNILVKKNPQFDPSLQIEGAGATSDPDAGKTQDEAIAAVLEGEQQEKFKQMQAERTKEQERWTNMLGIDPSILQGLGGGFGGFGGFGGGGRRGRGR